MLKRVKCTIHSTHSGSRYWNIIEIKYHAFQSRLAIVMLVKLFSGSVPVSTSTQRFTGVPFLHTPFPPFISSGNEKMHAGNISLAVGDTLAFMLDAGGTFDVAKRKHNYSRPAWHTNLTKNKALVE